MVKSLKEIEKDFNEQYQSTSNQKVSKQSNPKERNRKQMKLSLIADIIFCFALAGVGFSALLLSWSEQAGYAGWIYTLLSEYREAILVGFLILIVISFVLRFFGKKKKEGGDAKE